MPESLFHISFYRFVKIDDVQPVIERLYDHCRLLKGRIVVANEGINAMLAGSEVHLNAFEQAMNTDKLLSPYFAGIDFKRSACSHMPFDRIKVHHKTEILALGLDQKVDAINKTGIDLNPQAWRELIQRDDVVLIDNRNSFEYRLGRFKNAIDPEVRNFREFHSYIEDNLPQWQAQGKKIAMYCTGGIRCEKTSAWMLDLGIPVYQLEGGIINYFRQMPDADKDWQGECFVFDSRVALDTHLQETGRKPQEVYNDHPEEEWRLRRAIRLEQSAVEATQ